jgi:hypothetical protein
LFNVASEIIDILALDGSLHEVDARVTTTVFGFYRSLVSIRSFNATVEFTSVSSVDDDVVTHVTDEALRSSLAKADVLKARRSHEPLMRPFLGRA